MAFADGLQFFELGEFDSAVNSFEAALSARPNDPTAAKYLVLCEDLRKSPRPDNWSGIYVMTAK
jgi:hypothetical protein